MRTIRVDAGRLGRWCEGFAARHGGPPAAARSGAGLLLRAPDGATALLCPPFRLPEGAADLDALLRWTTAPRRCAVLLVRRGGYACAVVESGAVTASKVGSRYVQSRTAAGGWSQQRFARRRDNQARELASAAADVAVRLLVPQTRAGVDWLVTGGDRPLVEAVLADARLARLARLRRGPHLAVGDPRGDVVRALPGLLDAVRVELAEPDVPPSCDLPASC